MSIDDDINYTHCMITTDAFITPKNRVFCMWQFVGHIKNGEMISYIKRIR